MKLAIIGKDNREIARFPVVRTISSNGRKILRISGDGNFVLDGTKMRIQTALAVEVTPKEKNYRQDEW